MRKDECKNELRNGVRAVSRNVHDINASVSCRLAVDVVVAGRELADEAQVRTGVHDLRGDGALAGQRDLGVADAGSDILGRGALVHGQIAQRGQIVPAQIAGVQGIPVQYDKLRHIAASFEISARMRGV